MEYHNEQERYIAILEASLPYVAPQSRHAIQLLLQSHSLVHLVKEQPDYALEAMQVGAKSDTSSDPQELLLHIQEFLTPKESDFVKTILNFYNANLLFQNYQKFAKEHMPSDPPSDLSAASMPAVSSPLQTLLGLINNLGAFGNVFSGRPSGTDGKTNNNMFMDFLISQLNPEQKATFEQFRNIMYNKGE